MRVVRTFASHAHKDRARVYDILDQCARLGVRPWLDEVDMFASAGLSLSEQISQAVCTTEGSLTLFLSKASIQSDWVQKEAGEALQKVPAGLRIIPFELEDLASVTLPSVVHEVLRKRGETFDTISVKHDDPMAVQRLAAAALQAAGADRASEITLHLGHRLDGVEPVVPADFQRHLCIDLRGSVSGNHADYCPSTSEWPSIVKGMSFLRSRLKNVRQIHLCGRAPLGVAAVVGQTWDRGSPVGLLASNRATTWSSALDASHERLSVEWTPDKARFLDLVVRHEGVANEGGRVTIALLAKEDHHAAVRAWNTERGSPSLLILRPPASIGDAAEASGVLSECVGAIGWAKRVLPASAAIDLISGLPLALTAFLTHHLRQVGRVCFQDQVLPRSDEKYREAHAWG